MSGSLPPEEVSEGSMESRDEDMEDGLEIGIEHEVELVRHVHESAWTEKLFSDVIVHAFGESFLLHKVFISRSPYFERLLSGEFKESSQSEVRIQFDDEYVNREAFEAGLACLYGKRTKLTSENAHRILAVAVFLGLEALAVECTDFVVEDISTNTFLQYHHFSEGNYGDCSKRINMACWRYLYRAGATEGRQLLTKLSFANFCELISSNKLWVHSEWHRIELAFGIMLETFESELDANNTDTMDRSDGNACFLPANATASPGSSTNASKPTGPSSSFWYVRSISEELKARFHALLQTNAIIFAHLGMEQLLYLHTRFEELGIRDFSAFLEKSSWNQLLLRHCVMLECSKGSKGCLGQATSAFANQDLLAPENTLNALGEMNVSPEEVLPHGEAVICESSITTCAQRAKSIPPFRFGVEFANVQVLLEKNACRSPEVYYAGSLWKVSLHSFSDEDPKGRQTLGIFLHRRPAEGNTASSTSGYVDTRQRVSARYQLVCVGKREMCVLGTLSPDSKTTLLPNYPKGWGWRTAMLMSELPEFIERGSLKLSVALELTF